MIVLVRAGAMLAAALLAVAPLAAFAQAPKGGAGGPPPTPVVVDKVRAVSEAPSADFTGLIQPATKVLLSAEVAGRLDKLLKKQGDAVARSEVVAVLDNPTLEDELAVRRARLLEIEAQVRLSETQQERNKQLYEKKLISAQQFEDGKLNLAVSQARLKSEQIQVQGMEDQLKRMVIRSPIKGQVITSTLEVGQWITPNQPIFEIFNYDEYEVLVGVPGRLMGSVPDSAPVTVNVPELNTELTGRIQAVVRHVDASTGNFSLRVGVANKAGLPLSGLLARVRLPLTEAGRILTVPRDAIVRRGDRTHIVLVNGEGKAQIVPVEVKGNHGAAVIVAGKGLADGMDVVVRGNERLFPGTAVRISNEAGTGAAPGAAASKPASG